MFSDAIKYDKSMRCRELVDLYNYLDYRQFLKDYYLKRKRRDGSFNYRAFSDTAGFSAPNFYKLVADGKRNLSQASILKFAKGLELNQREASYFEDLVNFNQASNSELKSHYFGRLARFKGCQENHILDHQSFTYFSLWYVPVIRELMSLDDFRLDYEWIATVLLGKVTAKQAQEAVIFLIENGFATRTRDGSVRSTSLDVSSGPVTQSLPLKTFQLQMAARAYDSLENEPKDVRDFSFVTLPINASDLQTLKEEIRAFRKQLLRKFRVSMNKNAVYQVNFQVFPLALADSEGDQ